MFRLTTVTATTTTRCLSLGARGGPIPFVVCSSTACSTSSTAYRSITTTYNERMATTRTTATATAATAAAASSYLYSSTRSTHSTSTRSTVTSSATSSANSDDDDASSSMKDEYGRLDAVGESFVVSDFVLENGQVLPHAELRYRTYGTLDETTRDNVLVVCHALTGNASLDHWWGELLGEKRPFDTSQYFVVCCNILGSCYGSTSPVSIHPNSNHHKSVAYYGMDFPDVSVQDTVRLQLRLLKEKLNVQSVQSVIGGSFGGMQAMEFAVQAGRSCVSSSSSSTSTSNTAGEQNQQQQQPYVKSVIPIACNAQHQAWQIAISEVQRQAIYRDPEWQAGNHMQATQGLQVARQIGMISYRTPAGYAHKFDRSLQNSTTTTTSTSASTTGTSDSSTTTTTNTTPTAATTNTTTPAYGQHAKWQVASYLVYQGEKFISRFDPVTYVKLTQQMDSHDVARNRGNDVAAVLKQVQIPALVLGIDSDVLYPIQQQQELARLLPRATFQTIHSEEGHDGFLLEQEQVGRHITEFLQQLKLDQQETE